MKGQKASPTKAKPAPKKSAPVKAANPIAMDKKWQAESDARTLIDAEKIKADKKRLGAAKAHAAEQAAAAARIGKL